MLSVFVGLALVPLRAAQPIALQSVPENSPDCQGVVEVKHAELAGARLSIVRDCGSSDGATSLVVAFGDTVLAGGSVVTHYYGANMTEAPQVMHELDESFGHGTLADGSVAMVWRVIWEDRADCRCQRAGCCDGIDLSRHHESYVQVCRIDAQAKAASCAEVRGRCKNDACTPVSLKNGKLVVEGETFEIK